MMEDGDGAQFWERGMRMEEVGSSFEERRVVIGGFLVKDPPATALCPRLKAQPLS